MESGDKSKSSYADEMDSWKKDLKAAREQVKWCWGYFWVDCYRDGDLLNYRCQ